MFQVVRFLGEDFPISACCQALGVSRNGYREHIRKPQRKRKVEDRILKVKIRECFEESRGTYGCDRIAKSLRIKGTSCGKTRASRLMREMGLRAKEKRRFRPRTTRRDPCAIPAPNYLAMIPQVQNENRVWVTDITYVQTSAGWGYVAAVLDLFSRRCLAWDVSNHMGDDLVIAVQKKAFSRRPISRGLILHSDRGSQYTGRRFKALLGAYGATGSMSGKGHCYDNATMESFWATLKTECLCGSIPEDHDEVRRRLFEYIDGFYNTRRMHSSLGYLAPVEFERKTNQASR